MDHFTDTGLINYDTIPNTFFRPYLSSNVFISTGNHPSIHRPSHHIRTADMAFFAPPQIVTPTAEADNDEDDAAHLHEVGDERDNGHMSHSG